MVHSGRDIKLHFKHSLLMMDLKEINYFSKLIYESLQIKKIICFIAVPSNTKSFNPAKKSTKSQKIKHSQQLQKAPKTVEIHQALPPKYKPRELLRVILRQTMPHRRHLPDNTNSKQDPEVRLAETTRVARKQFKRHDTKSIQMQI